MSLKSILISSKQDEYFSIFSYEDNKIFKDKIYLIFFKTCLINNHINEYINIEDIFDKQVLLSKTPSIFYLISHF